MDYLPPEIVALIAEQIYADDIFNLRLAARCLRACSDPVFIKRYFQQRIHLLSRNSLVTLLTVSSLPKFGPSIEEIHLSSDHLIPDYIRHHPALFESIPRPFWCSAPQGILPESGWESYLIDQKCFQERGSGIICLNRILEKTFNCHTIVLNGWDRPWGAGSVRRKTGFFLTSSAVWVDTSHFIEEAIHLTTAITLTKRVSGGGAWSYDYGELILEASRPLVG